MDIRNMTGLLVPRGFVVWIDILSRWHSSEYDLTSLAYRHSDWLLSPKQPWQRDLADQAIETWVIPVSKRHRALNIAKKDYKLKLMMRLSVGVPINP